MSARRVVPLVLIVLAIAVNYPTLTSLWRTWSADAGAEATHDSLAEAGLPPLGAAPPGPESPEATKSANTFAPVLPSGELVDPFLRDADTTQSAATVAGRALLPQVTLILRTASSRHAVIDHATVAVGDKVADGVVQAIEADHVVWQAATGQTLRLPLPEQQPPAPRQPAPPPKQETRHDTKHEKKQ